jgi:hypothetical protein
MAFIWLYESVKHGFYGGLELGHHRFFGATSLDRVTGQTPSETDIQRGIYKQSGVKLRSKQRITKQ